MLKGAVNWDKDFYTHYGSRLNCLSSVVREVRKSCTVYLSRTVTESLFDDCVARKLFARLGGKPGLGKAERETVYFNSRCEPVNPPTPSEQACDTGFYEWKLSPISLMWNDDYVFGSSTSLTQFPIEPGVKGRTYRWHGSGETPLLVWDPEHSGIVRDGTQLFGHWTFGGPRTAAISTGGALPVTVRWKNGFDALGSLDSNGDGEVSGDELKHLALWFDRNRDGVSQPGEVRPVLSEGVTKLFFKADGTDERGHLIASRGFERIHDGVRRTGRAVDWFAEAEASGVLLVNKLISEPEIEATQLGGKPQTPAPEGEPSGHDTNETHAKTSLHTVNGVWAWRMKDAKDLEGFEPKGYFTFSTGESGEVTGHSLIELPFVEKHPVTSAVKKVELKGRLEAGSTFSFSIAMPKPSTTKLESTASRVTPEQLEGVTTVTRTESGKLTTLSYAWIAEKVAPEKIDD